VISRLTAAFRTVRGCLSAVGRWLYRVFATPRFAKIISDFLAEVGVLVFVFPGLEIIIRNEPNRLYTVIPLELGHNGGLFGRSRYNIPYRRGIMTTAFVGLLLGVLGLSFVGIMSAYAAKHRAELKRSEHRLKAGIPITPSPTTASQEPERKEPDRNKPSSEAMANALSGSSGRSAQQ
jgi:hypothetical protein